MSFERTFTWEDASVWRSEHGLTGLQCLARVVSGEFPQPAMGRLMDIRLAEVSKGRAVFVSSPADFHYNPMGVVHGGFAATILDSAMGCAVHTTLAAGDAYTTLELKVNYVRALTSEAGEVRCTGTVLNVGRTIAIAEGKLEGADGKLYGVATCTCLIRRAGERGL
ncbi:MAG: PaaI family thioesterase [Vicinamibacterales bacterium]